MSLREGNKRPRERQLPVCSASGARVPCGSGTEIHISQAHTLPMLACGCISLTPSPDGPSFEMNIRSENLRQKVALGRLRNVDLASENSIKLLERFENFNLLFSFFLFILPIQINVCTTRFSTATVALKLTGTIDDESRVSQMIACHFLELPNSPLRRLKWSGCEGIWGV